ncbi:hypothetical protein AB205_0099970, partial [Aquarana catesbeiana]
MKYLTVRLPYLNDGHSPQCKKSCGRSSRINLIYVGGVITFHLVKANILTNITK